MKKRLLKLGLILGIGCLVGSAGAWAHMDGDNHRDDRNGRARVSMNDNQDRADRREAQQRREARQRREAQQRRQVQARRDDHGRNHHWRGHHHKKRYHHKKKRHHRGFRFQPLALMCFTHPRRGISVTVLVPLKKAFRLARRPQYELGPCQMSPYTYRSVL